MRGSLRLLALLCRWDDVVVLALAAGPISVEERLDKMLMADARWPGGRKGSQGLVDRDAQLLDQICVCVCVGLCSHACLEEPPHHCTYMHSRRGPCD